MTGNKKLHFQALIRTGYVKKGGTAYVKRNFNHPMYRSGLYEPDIYSHDFCPVCEIPSEKAMDQKAQEHLPALSGTDQLIPAHPGNFLSRHLKNGDSCHLVRIWDQYPLASYGNSSPAYLQYKYTVRTGYSRTRYVSCMYKRGENR